MVTAIIQSVEEEMIKVYLELLKKNAGQWGLPTEMNTYIVYVERYSLFIFNVY